ncbi:hypothetical protein [Segetibacter aerophilus]|uniref:hypothetical protein n=1 Tax=Segetibacter aerophilus TaxID=670293 RepID=UPI0011BE828E|nr:hypothetical protein [Segetibacter aerophilus]
MILTFALSIMTISSISLFLYLNYLTSKSQKEIKGLPKAKEYRQLATNAQVVDFSDEYALVEAV